MEHPPALNKMWELTPYELNRVPQEALTDDTEIAVSPRSLHSELMCPICLDMLKNTMTTKECLHRFCHDCIITALRSGNKECPTCRKKLVSKRSLRADPNFDALISKIYPSRDEYEADQQRKLAKVKQAVNPALLTQSIEEGLRQQSLIRNQKKRRDIDSNSESNSRKNVVHSDDSNGESSMSDTIAPLRVTEYELVFKPHPNYNDAEMNQVRYIKTTSKASIEHLSKFLATRIGFEKQEFGPEAGMLTRMPSDHYDIFIVQSDDFLKLNGSLSLQNIHSKYWNSNRPIELFYSLSNPST